jgi:cell shape-determining protein MreD
MFAYLISIPAMLILSVLQSTAISRIILIHGSADIVLLAVAAWAVKEKGYNAFLWALIGGLFIALTTAMPFYIPVASYLFVALLAHLLFSRIWQSPIMMLILIMVAGTLFQHTSSILYLQTTGMAIRFSEAFQDITLPSLLLNFFFLFPIYVLMTDLRHWVLPEEDYE